MLIIDGSSAVCSSDPLRLLRHDSAQGAEAGGEHGPYAARGGPNHLPRVYRRLRGLRLRLLDGPAVPQPHPADDARNGHAAGGRGPALPYDAEERGTEPGALRRRRSEEHTSELQSLMRNSYAEYFL